MENLEQQPNIESNPQTLESELSLTKQEIEEFKKLPEEERDKQRNEQLAKLKDLQIKLDQAIQEAIKTGNLTEAKRLENILKTDIEELESKFYIEGISLKEAKEILEQDFLGKEEIERAFDIKIEDKDIPEIPFTKEDIEKAKELGQFLILRTDKIDKKTPLTIENLNKHLKGKTKEGGKILYSDSYKSEDLYKTEIPKLSWALTSKELIPDSTSKNYLQQTELIVKYLKEKVFKDTDISESYQQAITEFEAQKDEIEKLMTTDWKKAAEKLEKLQINQLTRQTPVETIYDLIAYLHTNNQRLLENKYTWTKRRFSDGRLVDVGAFDSRGADLDGWRPGHSSGRIGVSFSRSL